MENRAKGDESGAQGLDSAGRELKRMDIEKIRRSALGSAQLENVDLLSNELTIPTREDGRTVKRPKAGYPRHSRKLQIPGTLDHAFRHVGGRDFAIGFARLAGHSDPQLKELALAYDECTKDIRDNEPGLLERLCLGVGLSPSDFFGRICAAAHRSNYDTSRLAAASAAPDTIAAAAKFARKESGHKDRQLILQAAGVIDKQPLVTIDQRQQSVNMGGAQTFEELTSQISGLLRGDVETIQGEIVE